MDKWHLLCGMPMRRHADMYVDPPVGPAGVLDPVRDASTVLAGLARFATPAPLSTEILTPPRFVVALLKTIIIIITKNLFELGDDPVHRGLGRGEHFLHGVLHGVGHHFGTLFEHLRRDEFLKKLLSQIHNLAPKFTPKTTDLGGRCG